MSSNELVYRRARAFIEEHGRPLDRALLRYHFEDGLAGDVVAELAHYQNADGGFGNALDPDLRAPESSALATSVAFQILRAARLAPRELVAPALAYLIRTFDRASLTWRIIPVSATDSPHAPWWNQASLAEAFNSFRLNPTAELLGYFYEHRGLVPPELPGALPEAILARLAATAEIDMHDFLCCARLLDAPNLDPGYHERLAARLAVLLDSVIERNPAGWASYSLRPLQVAPEPAAPLAPLLAGLIPENLDYELRTQGPDGAWEPNWDWGDAFPDAWRHARIEWSARLTLDRLLVLRRYGRLATSAASER